MNRSTVNPCSKCSSHELDIAVLRSNNEELVTTVVELRKEVAKLRDRNKYLQEQFFTVHSKLVSTAIIPSVEAVVRKCVPKLLEVSDEITKLAHLCQIGSSAPISEFKGVRTFAVTPHTVNGHVLNNPIINIPRLSNSSSQSPNRRNTVNSNVCQSPTSIGLAGPSRSSGKGEENLYNIRLTASPVGIQYLNESPNEIRYDEVEENNTFNQTRSEGNPRLSVIPEENVGANSRSPCNSQIRIYIDRINVDQVNDTSKNLQHASCNSLKCEKSQDETQTSVTKDELLERTKANGSNSVISLDDSSRIQSNAPSDLSIYPPQTSFQEFFETLSLTPSDGQLRNSTPTKKNSPIRFPLSTFVTRRRHYQRVNTMKTVKVVLERMNLAPFLSRSPTNRNESDVMENEANVSEKKRKVTPKSDQSIIDKKPKQEKTSPETVRRVRPPRSARPTTPLVEPSLNRKMRR